MKKQHFNLNPLFGSSEERNDSNIDEIQAEMDRLKKDLQVPKQTDYNYIVTLGQIQGLEKCLKILKA